MMRRFLLATVAIGCFLLGLSIDPQSGEHGPGVRLIAEAEAVIGRPWTPASVAGVARRTTRRVIRRSAIYVAALPGPCTPVVINGGSYHQCGATYYQPYQGQYVVVYVD